MFPVPFDQGEEGGMRSRGEIGEWSVDGSTEGSDRFQWFRFRPL